MKRPRENLKEAVQLVLETNRQLAEESLAGKDVIREPLVSFTALQGLRPWLRSLKQISTRGLFISTNNPIFVKGSRLKIEIQSANGRLQAEAVVRHAKKSPPHLVQVDRPRMGVEFIDPSPELRDFLSSL